MLTDNDRDELLIRVDERVKKLRDDMKEAKSITGFARCQVHKTEVDGVKNSLKWSRRLIAGGLFTVVVKTVYDFFTI